MIFSEIFSCLSEFCVNFAVYVRQLLFSVLSNFYLGYQKMYYSGLKVRQQSRLTLCVVIYGYTCVCF